MTNRCIRCKIKKIHKQIPVQEAGPKPAASTLLIDWFIRLVKGVLIGIGFITPGLSGVFWLDPGAL